MIIFLVRIVTADLFILLIQTVLLLYRPFHSQTNDFLSDLIIHLIFTIRNDVILFLNPPLLVFLYYAWYLLKCKLNGLLTLKLSMLCGLNFIILYFISWIEMLLLISGDIKG